jgi:hypothetical protein
LGKSCGIGLLGIAGIVSARRAPKCALVIE